MDIYKKTKMYLKSLNLDEKEYNDNINMLKQVIDKKNLKDQYGCAFDLICKYLDDRFMACNYCKFENSTCIMRRYLSEKKQRPLILNGCCYSIKYKKNCKYLGSNGCTIKNIACKLHTCMYLKKQGIRYTLKDVYFTKYLFNYWQKYYISNTFFKSREYVLKGIYARRLLTFRLK